MSNDIPAFPSPGVVIDDYSAQHQQGAYEGMSLRDYFAAKAMGSIEPPKDYVGIAENQKSHSVWARRCYAMADAMLAERAK